MLIEQDICEDFPYSIKTCDVLDSQMAYIEQGHGDPILFLHGVPTSSYLWRNVLPHVATVGRCIAPDLIGFGESSKPDIDYSITDHLAYVTEFIEKMALKNITLVMHGWGAVIGFAYAQKNSDNIKGLAFYEAPIRPNISLDMMALPVQQLAIRFAADDDLARKVIETNFFLERFFKATVMRELTPHEFEHYNAPFQLPIHRKPLLAYLRELPWMQQDQTAVNMIRSYGEWLQQTDLPKLLLYAVPGFMTTIDMVSWAKTSLSNLSLVDLGDGLHCAQEINPELMGKLISVWQQGLT